MKILVGILTIIAVALAAIVAVILIEKYQMHDTQNEFHHKADKK